ncbi:hypothetical protein HKD37_08G023864 [Glycine soja]
MRRYGGGILYAALPLQMQRGCFRLGDYVMHKKKLKQYSKTFHLSYKCVSVYAYLDNCNMQCQWIIKANSSREEEDVQKVSTRETQKMHLATASMVFKIPF